MTQRLLFILSCFNPIANLRQVFVRDRSRFPAVDGLRALSMMYVVLTHAMVVLMIFQRGEVRDFVTGIPWHSQWVLMGDKGVDAFFVISGFLIGRLLMLEHQRQGSIHLKTFYFRRWLRLTPVYLLFLGVWSMFAAQGIDKTYLWAYAFYLNNFLDESHRYIPWLWSLAVEEQFYLVFPALMSLFFFRAKRAWPFWLILFGSSILIRVGILWANPDLLATGADLMVGKGDLNGRYNQALYINLYTRFGPLVMGAFVAYLMVYCPKQFERLHSNRNQSLMFAGIVAIVLALSVVPIYRENPDLPQWFYYLYHAAHRHIFALMIVLLIVISIHPKGIGLWVNRLLGNRLMYPFAQLSYSMYLFHLPVLYLTYDGLTKAGWSLSMRVPDILLLAAIGMAPLALVSLITFLLVEAPFIRMRELGRAAKAATGGRIEQKV